jgi:hypothetical protein
VISEYCDNVIGSYMRNTLGETRLLLPGIEEPKPQFQLRSSQGMIDMIVAHFESMNVE